MMNEYWIVTENKTGRVIAHCGDINDAIMMVELDSNNRSYSRHRFLLDQVIDVSSTTDKQLPTSEIVGGIGSSYEPEFPKGMNGPGESFTQIKLPEGQGKPIFI